MSSLNPPWFLNSADSSTLFVFFLVRSVLPSTPSSLSFPWCYESLHTDSARNHRGTAKKKSKSERSSWKTLLTLNALEQTTSLDFSCLLRFVIRQICDWTWLRIIESVASRLDFSCRDAILHDRWTRGKALAVKNGQTWSRRYRENVYFSPFFNCTTNNPLEKKTQRRVFVL